MVLRLEIDRRMAHSRLHYATGSTLNRFQVAHQGLTSLHLLLEPVESALRRASRRGVEPKGRFSVINNMRFHRPLGSRGGSVSKGSYSW